jgi:hypothetical protein
MLGRQLGADHAPECLPIAAELLESVCEVRSMQDDGRNTALIAEVSAFSPDVIGRQIDNEGDTTDAPSEFCP